MVQKKMKVGNIFNLITDFDMQYICWHLASQEFL